MSAQRGFYGKIPARGDFVGAGLPRPFVAAWDGWLQRVIADSRERLGAAWREAWMEAPVWCFALPRGLCGDAGAAVGLWLPSTDRAGRLFPLTFASVDGEASATELLAGSAAWLAHAEAVGRAALGLDLAPEAIASRLGAPAPPVEKGGPDAGPLAAGRSLWWSDGSPRVPPTVAAIAGLPDGADFAGMLDARPARAGAA